MIIDASVRPKGLKRGVTTKKVHEVMGWGEELGLSRVVMNLELTAEDRGEVGLLKFLYDYFLSDDRKIVFLDAEDKEICRASRHPSPSVPTKEAQDGHSV